eukprot:1510121-Pyramimonas_sp.AAC.1
MPSKLRQLKSLEDQGSQSSKKRSGRQFDGFELFRQDKHKKKDLDGHTGFSSEGWAVAKKKWGELSDDE